MFLISCMRVIYYRRNTYEGYNVFEGAFSECFYVPEEKIVLVKERIGSFGTPYYTITNRKEILEEAEAIAKGKAPFVKNVNFYDVEEFDYDSLKLRRLIQATKKKNQLEKMVISGFKDLLKQIE